MMLRCVDWATVEIYPEDGGIMIIWNVENYTINSNYIT